MDLVGLATAATLGALAGSLAGLVPALHANTLLPVAVAMGAAPGGPAADLLAVALVALAVAHAFTSVLPQTYIGVPGGEASLAALPGHRMVRAGDGRAAVRTCLDATLVGLVTALVLLLPVKWLLAEPGRLGEAPAWAGAALAGAAMLFLVGQEWRRGLAGIAWAAATMALAGATGLVAMRLSLDGWTPLPASALLPLLAGLFGAAGLVETLLTADALPAQGPARPVPTLLARRVRGAAILGAVAAIWGTLVPGLTSAGAASTTARDSEPRTAMAALSAVAVAHQLYSTALPAIAGQARTGLAIAVEGLAPAQPWTAGRMPSGLAALLAAAVAGGLIGYATGRLADRAAAPVAQRVPPRRAAALLLAALTLFVTAVAGPVGLLLFACAATVGLVPLCAGVRRVHLTGALLVPAFWRLASAAAAGPSP